MIECLLFVWMDGGAGRPAGPLGSTRVELMPLSLCTVGEDCEKARFNPFSWYSTSTCTEVMNVTSDSSHQHYCHLGSFSLSPPIPPIPSPAWFIKLLWQFTLMLFPATQIHISQVGIRGLVMEEHQSFSGYPLEGVWQAVLRNTPTLALILKGKIKHSNDVFHYH